ncbi:GbsR/MarR family transcriptional regulator [Halopenitus persicus]|uniref:HTH-type transcriptional regulator n=1 Tax=Halopenitus persicus TaxID=1048396 RepID=A0A1H3ERV6_9EURY|nr:MarR family transcriptional regulator [Halopenitus persicus]SDX81355.1 DNA-binding transcriptional regulator GbsR, MarR family [Halopenitus persicus]
MSDAENRAIARERVIESMEQSAEVYGLSRSAGRIYGVLYFATEPLSIPELVEETGYAKSTISNVTRTLTRIGLIHRRSSEGGGRRVQYSAEREIWFILQDVLQQYVQREVQTTLRTVQRAESQLPDGEDGTEAERIAALRGTYEDLQEVITLAADLSAAELREALEEYER